MPITMEIWWKSRVIRQAIYEALTSSYQTAGKGDVQPRGSVGPEIEPSDNQESKHRTWRVSVELWEGLAKGVSDNQEIFFFFFLLSFWTYDRTLSATRTLAEHGNNKEGKSKEITRKR